MLTNEDLQAISGLITSAVTASEGRMMARMDKIDARLANMDARLDNMDTRLDNMDARLDNMDARLGRVEHELVEVKDRLCAVGRAGGGDHQSAVPRAAPASGGTVIGTTGGRTPKTA